MTTLPEAFSQLDSVGTLAELKSLAFELSAEVYKPNAVLYSGILEGGVETFRLANKSAEPLNVAVQDKTARGQFLLSEEFSEALDRIVINENPGASIEAIEALSASAVGSGGVLYNGQIGVLSASAVASEIAQSLGLNVIDEMLCCPRLLHDDLLRACTYRLS